MYAKQPFPPFPPFPPLEKVEPNILEKVARKHLMNVEPNIFGSTFSKGGKVEILFYKNNLNQ
jgi:hypothetical protein